MRILKLVIWDLDETVLTGILEEGDETINPVADKVMAELRDRGILQALATQNPSEIILPAIEKFGWEDLYVQVEADLGPKIRKVNRILNTLEVNPVDVAFIDDDAFERDSIAVQVPGITSWSVSEVAAYLETNNSEITEEGRRRPEMYREQLARTQAEEEYVDYEAFLRTCQIEITIRPYEPNDAKRVGELLTRTHRMNLGILPVEEAISRLSQPDEHHVIVAEMRDAYGDMGRVGIIHFRPADNGDAIIESLAISCRTRARGLSLAMLVGMLRHPRAKFDKYRCRYVFNGSNRPLRMLLMGSGFKPDRDTDEVILTKEQLEQVELPDWVNIMQVETLWEQGV